MLLYQNLIIGIYIALSPKTILFGSQILTVPEHRFTWEGVERSLAAMTRKKQSLWISVADKPYIIKLKFNPSGTSRKKVFGDLLDAQRYTLTKQKSPWRSLFFIQEQLILFDPVDIETTSVIHKIPKSMKYLANLRQTSRNFLPWDLIRPPTDPRGEATRYELSDMRKKFKLAYLKAPAFRVTGITNSRISKLFLALTRIPEFPLVTIKCDDKDGVHCQFSRACFANHLNLRVSDLVGIAFSKRRNLLYLANRKHHRIDLIWWDGGRCYSLARKGSYKIPKQLKSIENIYIDDEDGLWLITEFPDDYLNATLYHWPKEQW